MRVLIGVPTYKRPLMLKQALSSLARLDAPTDSMGMPADLRIVVVDNDPDRSARETVSAWLNASPIPAGYATSARRGVASARNALIDQALAVQADFCAWFDDDEMVRPNWLTELLEVQRRYGADVVAGPVNVLLPPDCPAWIRPLYRAKPRTTGTTLKSVATSNVLFSTRLIRDWQLRFDESFDLTGGEDIAFFAQAAERGATMVWAADAWVDEHAHVERLTRSAVYLRHFGTAAAHAQALRSRKGLLKAIARMLPKAADRVVSAILITPLLLVQPDRATAKFLAHAGTGIGSLAGMFGFGHDRYRNTQGH